MNTFLKIVRILLLVPLVMHNTEAQQPSTPKKAPNVLVTLKPLYSLTHALMKGVGEPILLMEGAADPHHFSLTPSHSKLIKKADLVVWVGPMLEGFMIKPLTVNQKNQVPLISTKGLKILHRQNTPGCLLEEISMGKNKSGVNNDNPLYDDRDAALDPHIWLDINNAILMTQEIAYHLKALDLEHAEIYLKNAKALVKKLEAFKVEIEEKARNLENFHFIAFHDAYGYLEHRYKLTNSAAETIKGHDAPSLKAFSTIRRLIKEKNIHCILVDPHHPSEVAQRLSKEFDMSLYQAGPLGIDINKDSEHYFSLIRQLIQQLDDCRQKHNPKK